MFWYILTFVLGAAVGAIAAKYFGLLADNTRTSDGGGGRLGRLASQPLITSRTSSTSTARNGEGDIEMQCSIPESRAQVARLTTTSIGSEKSRAGTILSDAPERKEVEHHSKPSFDLVVQTLNFQYYASYPKDLNAAEQRLQDTLGNHTENPPDIICVQEGLQNRDVLGPVGFERHVCSAESQVAQTVKEMVYGDTPTLNACPEENRFEMLCNQIYVRKESTWKVEDKGAMQISSDLHLTGGGGRQQGKLAIRSMVWVKLRKHEVIINFEYTLDEHRRVPLRTKLEEKRNYAKIAKIDWQAHLKITSNYSGKVLDHERIDEDAFPISVQFQMKASSPSVYVMCTHITGGRFEDQYFLQSLAEERKNQMDRINTFYNERPRPHCDDVGIIVGDFNATTVYTANGPMHGYFASGIATSKGVQADAKWNWNIKWKETGEDVVLEDYFKDYMISPFNAISNHNWTFAYDRQHVPYTSGFGHTIDHMAMSRPLMVRSTGVVYMTNQKFGNKPPDTDLPLSDHNSVKTTFSIAPREQMHTFECRTESDFLIFLRRYRACLYLTGFGAKQQYADPEAVVQAVANSLFEDMDGMDLHFGKGKWVALFAGDPLNEDKPDIAVLVNELRKRYGMNLIAIQADYVEKHWGGVDKHIDAVYYYPTDFMPDGSVAWGGVLDGELVGATRILFEVSPLSGIPFFCIAAGGGEIAVAELEAAYDNGYAIRCIQAEARIPADPSQPYGPCQAFWDSLDSDDVFGDGQSVWRRKKA